MRVEVRELLAIEADEIQSFSWFAANDSKTLLETHDCSKHWLVRFRRFSNTYSCHNDEEYSFPFLLMAFLADEPFRYELSSTAA